MAVGAHEWFVYSEFLYLGPGIHAPKTPCAFSNPSKWPTPCSTFQRPVNAHFEAVSGLQFCWHAQDFQAFFIRERAKVLVYAVFRACASFMGFWPQTSGPQSSFFAMESEAWSTHWVETDPVELAMEQDWQANLAAEEAARQRAEDRTR